MAIAFLWWLRWWRWLFRRHFFDWGFYSNRSFFHLLLSDFNLHWNFDWYFWSYRWSCFMWLNHVILNSHPFEVNYKRRRWAWERIGLWRVIVVLQVGSRLVRCEMFPSNSG
jgi:hypothetical protein